jgi:hypothetical protein
MIAPVLPALAQAFYTTPGHIGFAIPLYLIPHGVLTLVWGPISDRFGRRRVIMGSLIVFVVLAALTTLAPTANVFLAMRMLTALAASGVVPIALALVARRTAARMARLVRGRRRVRAGACHRCDGSARDTVARRAGRGRAGCRVDGVLGASSHRPRTPHVRICTHQRPGAVRYLQLVRSASPDSFSAP